MEIRVLHEHGWSISALARELGLSRNTVRREIESQQARAYPERFKPTALSLAQAAHVARRVASCPAVRGTTLHLELRRDYGYQGSYPAFMRHLRPLRGEEGILPDIRFETEPGLQAQVDWAHLGSQRLGDELAPLFALVTVLGASRAPSIAFATERTRPTTLGAVVACLSDLGGVTKEILTDRDPAFCIGSTSDGRAILAPEWVDLCGQLGTVPRACRPYRAKTKGKVERLIREVKEDFLPWLSGQILPARPSLDDYARFARAWRSEVVLPRRHRTSGEVIGIAWDRERSSLMSLPPGLPDRIGVGPIPTAPGVIDLASRRQGEQVQVRDLSEYEVAL